MTTGCWVGLDLGTSGLKGVVVDATGGVVARGQRGYATDMPEPGAREQDPQHWLDAVSAVVEQLASQSDVATWRSVGLSAMIPTLVTVDAQGRPTGPAITWEDGRAEREGEALRDGVGGQELYRRTGQWVDGRYLVPMWQRIARTDPDRASRTVAIWAAKDWLLHALTGAAATDPSTATGFGCFDLGTGAWAPDLVEALPALPAVVDSTTSYAVTATWSGLPVGLPVAVGAADSVLGALGMGAAGPGDIAYVAGTSTVVLGIASEHHVDDEHRFLVTPTAAEGCWGLEMDLLATGAAFRWLARLVGAADESELLALAADADPHLAPLVLPYLAPGEQGALWDPALTGSVLGLTLAHGPGDLGLGLVHGVVLESRRCLRVLESLGFGDGPLRVAGGSAADPWYRQQLADATGRTVLAPVDGDSDASAVGAAIVAARCTGISIPAAGEVVATAPDPARAAFWEGLADRLDRARGLVGRGVATASRGGVDEVSSTP